MSYGNPLDEQREKIKKLKRKAAVYYFLAVVCLTTSAVGLLSIIVGC